MQPLDPYSIWNTTRLREVHCKHHLEWMEVRQQHLRHSVTRSHWSLTTKMLSCPKHALLLPGHTPPIKNLEIEARRGEESGQQGTPGGSEGWKHTKAVGDVE